MFAALAALASLVAEPTPAEAAVARVAEARSVELGRNPLNWVQALRLGRAVVASSEKHQIPQEVLLAMIEVESAYGMQERSSAKCRGVMQLNPRYASAFAAMAGLERWHIDDLEDNVDMGAAYLRSLLDQYGQRLPWAVSAYNRGGPKFEAQGRPVGRYAKAVIRKVPVLRDLLTSARALCY